MSKIGQDRIRLEEAGLTPEQPTYPEHLNSYKEMEDWLEDTATKDRDYQMRKENEHND